MSETAGRPSATTPDEVLSLFSRLDAPVITSRDVCDEFGVSTETARKKLAELEDRGILDRKEAGSGIVWYRKNWDSSQEERVVPFLTHDYLVVVDEMDETREVLEGCADRYLSYYSNALYKFSRYTVSERGYRTEKEIRAELSPIIEHPPFIDRVIELWYKAVGVVVQDDDETGSPLVKMGNRDELNKLLQRIRDDYILERVDDHAVLLNPETATEALRAIDEAKTVYDVRDNVTVVERVLQPVFNRNVSDLSPYAEVVGVDGSHRPHVWEPIDDEVVVVDDRDVEDQHPLDREQLREWANHVEKKVGWLWVAESYS